MSARLLKEAPRDLLSGGCAPEQWFKQLERLRERADGLERACAWLESGLPAERPHLRPKPLLGDCLNELVFALSDAAPVAPEEDQIRPAPRTRAGQMGPLAPPGRKPHTPAHENGRTRKPPGLDREGPAPARPKAQLPASGAAQTSRAVLERLAGPSAKRTVASKGLSQAPRGVSPGLRDPQGKPTPTGSKMKLLQAQPSGGDGQSAWTGRVAMRAWKSFSEHAVKAGRGSKIGEQWERNGSSEDILDSQWSWQLNGETVSTERLEGLVEEKQPGGSGRAEHPERKPVAKGSGPNPLGSALPEPPVSTETQRGDNLSRNQSGDPTSPAASVRSAAAGEPSIRSRAAKIDSSASEGVEGVDTRMGPQVLPRGPADSSSTTILPHDPGESLAGTAPWFAPPQLAPTLPPLHPVQRNEASLIPAAAFTAERSARREAEETAPDDLEELARKLRWILEEEARRHGIDV